MLSQAFIDLTQTETIQVELRLGLEHVVHVLQCSIVLVVEVDARSETLTFNSVVPLSVGDQESVVVCTVRVHSAPSL
eukprot:3712866-Rhodomonas_salina.1